MEIALVAGLSMVIQDVLAVCMVQAENRSHGWIAGYCDAGMWLMAAFSYGQTFNSHGREHVFVVVVITAANVFGNRLGVYVGNKYIKQDKSKKPPTVDW